MATPKSEKGWGDQGTRKAVALQSLMILITTTLARTPLQGRLLTSSFQLPMLISTLRQSKRLKWVFACTAHAFLQSTPFHAHPCVSLSAASNFSDKFFQRK